MSEQQDCPVYCISQTRWDSCPIEEKLQKQIAKLEKMAEARKLANHLLEQERNEMEAERDRLREALAEAVEKYGKPGGPWNVPGEPGSWIDKARKALEGVENATHSTN